MSTRDRLTARRRVVCSRVLADEAQLDEANGNLSRSRKQREEQRAALRPAAQYQIGVRRRLRGRWFNLVPADGRQFALVIGSLFGLIALVLVLGVVSATWAPLAMRPLVGRPIRLDAPGTLGDWLGAHLLATSAGIGILIYQLRRYRGDDYHGRYRMWRAIIAFLLLLSLDSVTHLRDALAATIDATWGGRSVIAGDDVVRLFLLLVGATAALPILAELRRSPLSVVFLLASVGTLAFPTALRLGVIESRPDLYGTWVGASRLLGRALILASAITYLRVLYREVRGMESSNLIARFLKRRARAALEKKSKASKPRTNDQDEHDEQVDEELSLTTRRRWWRWGRRDEDLVDNRPSRKRSKRMSTAEVDTNNNLNRDRDDEVDSDGEQQQATSPTKPISIQRTQPVAPVTKPDLGDEAQGQSRRSWFGWKSKEKPLPARSESREGPVAEKTPTHTRTDATKEDSRTKATQPKSGLFGWMNRGSRTKEEVLGPPPATTLVANKPSLSTTAARAADDEEEVDNADDRSGMTRAERKRLKKQQRRGRAA